MERPVAMCLALTMLAACASEEADAPAAGPLDPPFGPLSVTVEPFGWSGEIDLPPYGKGEATALALKYSFLLGYYVGTAGGRPGSGEAVILGIALGIAAAPVVAVYTAIVTPTEEDAKAAGAELGRAAADTDWSHLLDDAVRQAMRANALRESAEADAGGDRLHLTIEPPLLVLGGVFAIPTLTVRAQIVSGDDCLVDRKWHWNGESDSFADLGDEHAAEFRAQMRRGIVAIADALARDLALSAPVRPTPGTAELLVPSWQSAAAAREPFEHESVIASWDRSTAEQAIEQPCAKPLVGALRSTVGSGPR